ncbi:leucine-rich repeat-containing protein 7-like [Sinocyclocheilus grahami]|uniref:leucine-rich repeat-containing protein 7-like n=1 Tax=Sinocyclocheilus grahami TaxID=75366 RepID=UPI0007AC7661|nr:PREDICTED: leucine-rich repeat-containing protein 7-like [Sinocyclocheilus grahami]
MDNHSTLQLQCLEMTTKRKIIGRLVPCRCFRGEEEVISVLDYSHCSLQQVPKEIFSFERTLEELYLDANQIEELPKQLFNCQALKKLSMPDNDLSNLPTTIASLVNLKELDISKNGIQEFPDNIKCCKCLSVVEASVNPIAKLPDGFTQLLNLTQLFLNDAFLEYLPANFGRLSKLRILELRENHLKTMPKSIHRLSQLERLDLGSNEFSELVRKITPCISLLGLSLLGSVCCVNQTCILNGHFSARGKTGLSLLEEFDCSCNELESLPPTVGYLHSLRTFAADENFLTELPREIGNCKNVTVMSLRSNKLEFLPDEIGQMTKLRVLNLSDNRLKNLPFTFTKLKDLAALWLSDNQSKALIPLQTEAHPETKQRVLTNYMFPQQPRHDEDYQSDSDSFNPTLWEEQRQQRMTVAFEFEDKKEEEDNSGKVKVEINLKRYPTPYPEDLKNMVKSVQNLVGKTTHTLNTEKCSSGTNMDLHSQDKYEPKWPIAPKEVTEREVKDFSKPPMSDQGVILNSAIDIPKRKDKEDLTESSEISLHRVVPKPQQPENTSLAVTSSSCFCLIDSMGGSPNDIRISDMRPTLVEPPMYKPKVVLLGKEKKGYTQQSMLEQQNSLSTITDTQFHKRNGRYDEDYSSYQEPKKPIMGYPTKSLTQRRPLSARSYSTETYGASQARPVSARPTMAALLEKLPSDYNLSTCIEKSPEADMKMRPVLQKQEDPTSKMPVDWRQQLLRHIEAKRLDRSAVLKHNTVNFGMLYSGGYAAPHASRSMTINFYNNTKHENQTTQWLPLPNTPSQQSNILDNGQEVVSLNSQWAPYSLGRRDVPPENMNVIKKPGVHNHPHQQQTMMMTSATPPHRTARDQQYEGAINKVSIQQYQSPLPMPITTTSPRPQSARCFIQTKGQKSMDGFPEQLCVRIEKNPGLGFSISGGISGQGNPFKPSDMGIFVTRVQPDGPASNLLRPGDKILKVNGHSFLHMEHESAVSLLKNFPKTVDLVILRESTT